jgi:hypothetical protein
MPCTTPTGKNLASAIGKSRWLLTAQNTAQERVTDNPRLISINHARLSRSQRPSARRASSAIARSIG